MGRCAFWSPDFGSDGTSCIDLQVRALPAATCPHCERYRRRCDRARRLQQAADRAASHLVQMLVGVPTASTKESYT